jgi:hypothetical protein
MVASRERGQRKEIPTTGGIAVQATIAFFWPVIALLFVYVALVIRRFAIGEAGGRDNTEMAMDLMQLACGGGAAYSLYAIAATSGGSRRLAAIGFLVNVFLASVVNTLIVY